MLKGSLKAFFDLDRAVDLRRAGASFDEIARETGVCRDTASRHLRRAGVVAAAVTRPPSHAQSADTIQRVGAALDAKIAYRQIAHDLGLTVGQIAGIVHRHHRANERRQDPVRKPKSALTTRGDTPRRASAPKRTAADAPKPPPPPRPAVARVPVPVPAEPSLIASAPVALVLAGPGVCRWPLWSATDGLEQMSVWGAACGKASYCSGHAALAYQPPRARRAA